jgi:hypothetical protein
MSLGLRFVAKIGLAGLILGGLFVGFCSPLVEYVPVVLDMREKLVASPTTVTPLFLDHLERVLNDHGERYKRVSPTRLLISLRLRADEELVWNFTTKAIDSERMATPSAMP